MAMSRSSYWYSGTYIYGDQKMAVTILKDHFHDIIRQKEDAKPSRRCCHQHYYRYRNYYSN
jgi:hypothetical protein